MWICIKARRQLAFTSTKADEKPWAKVTEDDRALYLGTAGRTLWRYRSELAPVIAALILLLAGAWTHSTHRG